MTERITPEQATGKPPSHVLSSALIDAANSLFCKLLEYEREIERLRNALREIANYEGWARSDDEKRRLMLRAANAALAPPPAREEGVTP